MRWLLLLVPLMTACDLVTDPSLPAGAESFTPPAVYKKWWRLTQECSGLSGDYSHVAWYRVPNAELIPNGEGHLVSGTWDPVGNRIVLAGNSQIAGDLVRHEMLHALLRRGSHPRSAFIGRCSDVVVCTDQCIRDAGPAPPPDPAARLIDPTALQIGVEIIPSAPSSAIDDGFFMMIVTVRNIADNPVIVQLPPSGDAGPSGSFSYRIEGTSRQASYDLRAEVPEATWFAALQVKRFIFDLHIGAGNTRYDQMVGTFRFNGAYGDVWAPNPPTVVVSP